MMMRSSRWDCAAVVLPYARTKLPLAVVVLITVALSGCRRLSLETVPVSGTVTYQGKPVPYGVATFQPVDAGRGRSALAFIKADGTYQVQTLSDASGLVPGDYLVTVTVEKPVGPGDDRRQPQPGVRSPDEFPRLVRSGIKLSVGAGDGKKVLDVVLDETGQSKTGGP
jgi:hypothetical protein